MNKANSRVDRIEKEAAKSAKETSEALYADVTQRIRKAREGKERIALGDLEEEVHRKGPAGDRTLTKENFDSLLLRVEAGKKEDRLSDPDVLLDVTMRANAAVPRISESEINNLMVSEKGLSVKDGERALDQIRTTNNSLKDEALRTVNQRYSDARDAIREGMGVSGLILQLQEKLDPTQQGLIARAWEELWDRSSGRGGKEDPMTVAREILPAYQRALAGKNLLSIETYKRLIDVDRFPTEDALLQARDTMPEGDFYRRAKAYKEMREKERMNEVLNAAAKEDFGRKKERK